jgi:hypothetical protein
VWYSHVVSNNQTELKMNSTQISAIQIGHIYSGIRAGKFVVLALRQIEGEEYAQVKEVGPNGELGKGEFALPVSALK